MHGTRNAFHRIASYTPVATLLVVLSCGTIDKVNRLIDTYNKLGNNLNDATTDARQAASNASPGFSGRIGGSQSNNSGVPNVSMTAGKTGQAQVDTDDDGDTETVEVFVPDDNPDATYMSWQDEEGICWLYYTDTDPAESVLVFAPCESDGFWSCDLQNDQCQGCTGAGECTACPADSENFSADCPIESTGDPGSGGGNGEEFEDLDSGFGGEPNFGGDPGFGGDPSADR